MKSGILGKYIMVRESDGLVTNTYEKKREIIN